MKNYKKEKSELISYTQDVNRYAESFSSLYEEIEKDSSTDLEVQAKNKARANAYLDYMYLDSPLIRLRGLCIFFDAGPHLMRRLRELQNPSDLSTFPEELETTTFGREILSLLNFIRTYI